VFVKCRWKVNGEDDLEYAFKVNQGYDISGDIEKDHGRIETRRCSILSAKDFVLEETLSAWRNLETLINSYI
jgi:hypothetical protein